MDPEQTFIRVQERFSRMLTPKLRAGLEYMFLFIAITLFCVLVVMHANYVQQPGCSSELSGVEAAEAQLIRIKITSAGLWSQNASDATDTNVSDSNILTNSFEVSSVDEDGLTFLAAKFWLNWIGAGAKRAIKNDKEEPRSSFPVSAKETFKAAVIHFGRRWYRRLLLIWRYAKQIIRSFWKLWNFAGVNLNVDVPKWLHIFHLDRLFFATVRWLERKSKTFEPTYLYTMEKGYFLLPEGAKARHNIHTINISISARHSCFGNRWQQLLINRFVGYDTILMNSLLTSPGQGYLYNYQTKEFYNLSHAHEPPEGPARFGDYLVTKCGVLMMSLFVFFTTTMSVSFTLRETQTRMLKFTVQLQHHARHHLPTFQLIFVHVIESLVFVPIMIGILFFLFEFYDDQLLAFMVLILVWLSELFTLISVRTPISMKFFPRFFLLYFLVFHIYFFSYAYGFSYLALSTAAAFMQHLILYFWNRFEFHFTGIILIVLGFISKICYGIISLRKQQWTKVEKIVAILAWSIWIVQLQVPALQRFMQNRRSQLQQHPDFHITSSTFLASTLHITRLNTRNIGPMNVDMSSVTGSRPGHEGAMGRDGDGDASETGEQLENHDSVGVQRASLSQDDSGSNPGNMSSFSSLLLWILGGASSEGLNSFLSMFRDARDQGQVYREAPAEASNEDQNS